MKKILTLLTVLCFLFSGCGEEMERKDCRSTATLLGHHFGDERVESCNRDQIMRVEQYGSEVVVRCLCVKDTDAGR